VTIYITVAQALRIAERATGGPVEVRDMGLLASAIRRPATTVMGEDAYPDTVTKAAALLHSLARNHPLVDGNKRLALLATYVFLRKNGLQMEPDNEAAYDLVMRVAEGSLDEVDEVAESLRTLLAT
jgi:death on curing protein